MPDVFYLMGFFGQEPQLGRARSIEFERDLHLTLLPAFHLHESVIESFLTAATPAVAVAPSFTIKATSPTHLGGVPVQLIEDEGRAVAELHGKLVRAALSVGGAFYKPAFINERFTPHISHWDGVGTETVTALTLVRHVGEFGSDVRILANLKLGTVNE